MDQLKKQHDPIYQLKIQQGEIREKKRYWYPTKKKANYIEKNYGTQAMNKPIERRLVVQEVLKFVIFICSIPVLLIQGGKQCYPTDKSLSNRLHSMFH